MVYLPTFGCFLWYIYGTCRWIYHTWMQWEINLCGFRSFFIHHSYLLEGYQWNHFDEYFSDGLLFQPRTKKKWICVFWRMERLKTVSSCIWKGANIWRQVKGLEWGSNFFRGPQRNPTLPNQRTTKIFPECNELLSLKKAGFCFWPLFFGGEGWHWGAYPKD